MPGQLHVTLDRASGEPLRRQLVRELRDAIREGRLRTGVRLPASRVLARDLAVSRGVVTDAYEQLAAEGWLTSRTGAGTTVAARSVAAEAPAAAALERRAVRFDFTPVTPDVSMFPRRLWSRALARAVLRAADAELDYGPGQGSPALREALSGYLGRVRGTAADPSSVVVCGGYLQATNLLFAVLRRRGLRRIAFEDPSLADHWQTAENAGLECVPIAVDADGLRVDELAATDAQAVVITPNHQFPTGAIMGPERRRALLQWAREGARLIVEDDYDAEFRYDRRPLAAMQGLDPERILYIGTGSKILAPGLRLGWIVAPGSLVTDLADEKLLRDGGSSALDQLALADLISSGELDRHLRRVRIAYARRREELVAALVAALPGARIQGTAAGVHLVLALPDALDPARLRAEMAARSVEARLIERRAGADPGEPTRLVLGYGRLTIPSIGRAVAALVAAIGAARAAGDSARRSAV
jgi:GntR family transcriptional regulator/MocR family aminotransferase